MSDTTTILVLLITGLGSIALLMIRGWAKTWESRLTSQDDRLDGHEDRHLAHDISHATLKANLENITTITDETRKDVKELLRNSNGKRSTG